MAAFRFIHASDLHLGRKFANIPEPPDGNIRGRLMEARHGAIGRIAEAARATGAADILLAGDTFDTPTPSPAVIRQAVAAMGEAGFAAWWLLPGNHDNLREAEPLWDQIRQNAPGNVHVVAAAQPVLLSDAAMLLPCPVEWRSSGRDLTEDLVAMASAEGALRIGLAHGGVVDFTEGSGSVPPDRDRSARLDYLALGDWHGRLEVAPRVQYSGSPEQDRFKHGSRGVCLAVTVDGPGAPPQVAERETGAFLWIDPTLQLAPDQDAATALASLLPVSGRRDVLVKVRAKGWVGLPEEAKLRKAAARIGPEFAHFELKTGGLGTLCEEADLDEIDRAGALRLAANALKQEAEAESLSAGKREIAAAALARLYAYVKEAV